MRYIPTDFDKLADDKMKIAKKLSALPDDIRVDTLNQIDRLLDSLSSEAPMPVFPLEENQCES
jgi:hypothetical protein